MFDRIDKSYDKNSLQTPRYLFDWLNSKYYFDIDIAASDKHHFCEKYYSLKNSAFSNPWAKHGDTGFCNPPYGRKLIQPFLDDAIDHAKSHFTTVFVIPELNGEARTKDVMEHATSIIHFDQRIWFIHPITGEECKNNNRGSIIVDFSYKPFYKPAQHYFKRLSDIKERFQ